MSIAKKIQKLYRITCDEPGCTKGFELRVVRHNLSMKLDIRKELLKSGWLFNNNRTMTCPDCKNAGLPKENP